jgi:hypothetical protein
VPKFCRHNRLIQNCTICSREQSMIEPRAVVSGRRSSVERPTRPAGPSRNAPTSRQGAARVRVTKLERGADDGYRSPLVPGLRSSDDADRLASELAFAAARLVTLEQDPPGLTAEIADPGVDLEERTWLAFQVAYIGPLDDERPFASIEAVRTSWASGLVPDLDAATTGPRSGYAPGHGGVALEAYRAWAARAGSQAQAFTGEHSWAPQRRFARIFERLALPGLHRDTRFELLVSLGRLGCYELSAGQLELGGSDQVTVAAKRVFGIGDPLLLERRAAALAEGCAVPLEALDLALWNWESDARTGLGVPVDSEVDPELLALAGDALGR